MYTRKQRKAAIKANIEMKKIIKILNKEEHEEEYDKNEENDNNEEYEEYEDLIIEENLEAQNKLSLVKLVKYIENRVEFHHIKYMNSVPAQIYIQKLLDKVEQEVEVENKVEVKHKTSCCKMFLLELFFSMVFTWLFISYASYYHTKKW